MASNTSNTAQRHRQSAIDRLGGIVELAAQGRAALTEGADATETAALLEALKHDVKAVLDYLEVAAREAAQATIKTCGCGRSFTAEQWAALESRGVQESVDETGKYSLELRNCTCGSTIGIERKAEV